MRKEPFKILLDLILRHSRETDRGIERICEISVLRACGGTSRIISRVSTTIRSLTRRAAVVAIASAIGTRTATITTTTTTIFSVVLRTPSLLYLNLEEEEVRPEDVGATIGSKVYLPRIALLSPRLIQEGRGSPIAISATKARGSGVQGDGSLKDQR